MTQKDASFVRITGGEYRGRKIRTPGGHTHPMGERERLALFNTVNSLIEEGLNGNAVLDAFSGSGALAIEALSRGAIFALIIEKDPKAAKVIEGNLRELGIPEDRWKISNGDIYKLRYIDKPSPYRVVFMDPPYDEYDAEKIKKLAWLVSPGAYLVLSHPGDAPEIKGMDHFYTRKYASCYVSYYLRTSAFDDFR